MYVPASMDYSNFVANKPFYLRNERQVISLNICKHLLVQNCNSFMTII